MSQRVARILLLIGCLFAGVELVAAAETSGGGLDEAGESAAYLLDQALTPRRDGRHDPLLHALRHLQDPTLQPFFKALATAPQPALRLHAIQGLAELTPEHQLSLATLGEMEDPRLQAQLITDAMDNDLLGLDLAEQLLDWPGLVLPVKMVLATRLVEAGRFEDRAMLMEASKEKTLGLRGLAAVLLVQIGDDRGMATLEAINRSDERSRDVARVELLRTIQRHQFDRLASWAYSITTEPGVDPDLEMLALRVAMRLGHAQAAARWGQQFQSYAGRIARQRRLGIMALYLSPWLEPSVFHVMAKHEDAMIAQMGVVGQAIAEDSPDAVEHIAGLIELYHPMLNNWALSYAEHEARPEQAQFILLGLIVACEQSPQEGRLPRLADAAQATMLLMEVDPAAGVMLLRPILTNAQTDPLLKQAVLLGLVRSQQSSVSDVIAGVERFETSEASALALLLQARSGQALSESQMNQLRLIVRGGSKLQDSLRIQAAWEYLKRTDQIDAALDRVLR